MEAGRELDILVAENVMGWSHDAQGFIDPNGKRFQDVWERYPVCPPPYSTDISAAWKIVEKMSEHVRLRGWNTVSQFDAKDSLYFCSFGYAEAKANTAPLAICFAALKMAGVTIK